MGLRESGGEATEWSHIEKLKKIFIYTNYVSPFFKDSLHLPSLPTAKISSYLLYASRDCSKTIEKYPVEKMNCIVFCLRWFKLGLRRKVEEWEEYLKRCSFIELFVPLLIWELQTTSNHIIIIPSCPSRYEVTNSLRSFLFSPARPQLTTDNEDWLSLSWLRPDQSIVPQLHRQWMWVNRRDSKYFSFKNGQI